MDNGKPKQTLCGPRGYGLKNYVRLLIFLSWVVLESSGLRKHECFCFAGGAHHRETFCPRPRQASHPSKTVQALRKQFCALSGSLPPSPLNQNIDSTNAGFRTHARSLGAAQISWPMRPHPQRVAGVAPSAVLRGCADQMAFACHPSPSVASVAAAALMGDCADQFSCAGHRKKQCCRGGMLAIP